MLIYSGASLAIASAFAAFAGGADPSDGLKAAKPLAVDWRPFLSSASDAAAVVAGNELALVFGASAASGAASGDAARLSLEADGAGQAQQCIVWDTICAARHGPGGCSFPRVAAPSAQRVAAKGADPVLAVLLGTAALAVCIAGALALALAAAVPLLARARRRGAAHSSWCGSAALALRPMRAADYLNARFDDITAAFEMDLGATDVADSGGGGAYVMMGASLPGAAGCDVDSDVPRVELSDATRAAMNK